MEQHKFWNTQPINDTTIKVDKEEIIRKYEYDKNQIEPIKLPKEYEWSTLDLNNDEQISELSDFLLNNYLSNDNRTRLYFYSKESIKWYALCPGYSPELFVCVRDKETRKIVGNIFGVLVTVKVNEKIIKMVEIDLLAIDSRLRNNNMAPLLIKEITRRVNLMGIVNAIYSGTLDLPNKLVSARYFHRPINIKKLNEVDYFTDKITKNLSLYDKLYKPKENKYKLRLITKKDIPSCLEQLNNELKKSKVTRIFDKKTFEHYFISRNDIIYTYVYEKDNKITDMISYYIVDQNVKSNKYKSIKSAYLFYYFNNNLELDVLLDCALYTAYENKLDLLNGLNYGDLTDELLDKCKFKPGTALLHYYLYNYKCNQININEIYYPIF